MDFEWRFRSLEFAYLPDAGDDGDRFLHVIVLSVVDCPFDRPESVDGDGGQSEAGGEDGAVVADDPDAAQHSSEWPVAVHDVDRVEVHCNDGHQQMSHRQVCDEGRERRSQFLLHDE